MPNTVHTIPGNVLPMAGKAQQITGLSSVKTLTPPEGALFALVDTESQVVRWYDDGTTPTASLGRRLLPGYELEVTAGSLSTIKFIEEAPSAKLNVTYYRTP